MVNFRLIPGFEIEYQPDFRQKIADAWPQSIDDRYAKQDWGWSYDISVKDLAEKILDGIDDSYKTKAKKVYA
jgi:nucleoside-diphosphate-sugar epimerase